MITLFADDIVICKESRKQMEDNDGEAALSRDTQGGLTDFIYVCCFLLRNNI